MKLTKKHSSLEKTYKHGKVFDTGDAADLYNLHALRNNLLVFVSVAPGDMRYSFTCKDKICFTYN